MKAIIFLSVFAAFQFAQAGVVAGVATVEGFRNSDWTVFQVQGEAAQDLYNHLRVPAVGGIKRGSNITCAKLRANAYACSMTVNAEGQIEGDDTRVLKAPSYR